MNAETFMDLMNTLPDEMLVTAYKKRFSPYTEEESESASFSASDRTVTPKRSDASVKHPPRWITAAALAACMLFAVGVGALLLRGHQDNITTQSSQDDSAIQEVTAVYSDISVKTETHTIPQEQTTTLIAAETVQTQTAASTDRSIVSTEASEPSETDPTSTAETTEVQTETMVQTTITTDDGIPHISLAEEDVYEWTSGDPLQYKVLLPSRTETVFTWDMQQNRLEAACDGKSVVVIENTTIRNVFFTDLNTDGIPELCVGFTAQKQDEKGFFDYESFDRIVVYNPINQMICEPDRKLENTLIKGIYDYRLRFEDGVLLTERTTHPATMMSSLPVKVSGSITLKDDKLIFTENP